jgi:AraC family transcriptional regulator of adaptative response/methylated-DNA-[protein]-cysteine methyltransferase
MSTDYQRVAEAIHYLETNFQEQPDLDAVAAHLHLSPFHLQRLFTRWAGISPKRFLQFLTTEHAKQLLETAHSVLDASYASGLSSPSRLHDLFVSVEAVTPGEFKNKGEGLEITYGRHATPFGDALLATTQRGICKLAFVGEEGWQVLLNELQAQWPEASLLEKAAATQPLIDQIFPSEAGNGQHSLHLLLRGTNFQIKVWEALLRIPAGGASTYEEVAQWIGQPTASRAVGNAIGANPIAYLIPCHRVIRKSGVIQNYRWGATRKKAMLGWESARREVSLQ